MFESFQILIAWAAAAVSLSVGLGLWIGGRISKTPGFVSWGRNFVFAAVAIVLLSWVFAKQVDRDHARDAEARERAAQTSPHAP
jgi:predicted MFS family arabinose efflux permease